MTSMFVITFVDVFGLIALAVFFVIVEYFYTKDAWKKLRCRHDGGVNETMACDAICKKCGKNLGFIGKWLRERSTQPIKEKNT